MNIPVNQIKTTLGANDHPYRNGAWTPVFEELDTDQLEVIGTIPADIDGVYIRNTENPLHEAIGVYHPFDGDGMIHTMSFKDGKASYKNRFVRTEGFLKEQETQRSLWAGIAANPAKSELEGWGARERMKDASSTDVVVHGGEILSTFYMCGEGYRLDPNSLEHLGTAAWVPPEGVSAHPKVDLETGELLFFNYSKKAPYMHYGVVGADKKLKHYIPVPLPGPRLPHDMAFTKNYSILIDLPVFWKPELLAQGIHSSAFHEDTPTRFAIVPRYGRAEEIKWFEASPTFVLHWLNAWEEGEEIVVDGYFQENPDPDPIEMPGVDKRMGKLLANIDGYSLGTKLHRWRFNLRTGKTTEQRLDDENFVEFGMINQQYTGRPNRYVYSAQWEPGWFLFSGVMKHDLKTGDTQSYQFGKGRYGSEAPFAPRVAAKGELQDEDDGYIVSFITDVENDSSECVVLDAKDIAAGPVARIILPHRISSGTHATWAGSREIGPRS